MPFLEIQRRLYDSAWNVRMDYRSRLRLTMTLFLGLSLLALRVDIQAQQPNVLFVSIDDLNDWGTPWGGHSAAITPHLEQFVSEGAIVFQNAHCAGPVCCISRSAMLSGFMPHRTGVYSNSQNMRDSKLIQEHATLPEYFSKHGYLTLSMGKIFHKHDSENGIDAGQWAFDIYEQTSGGSRVDPGQVTSRNRHLIDGNPGPSATANKTSGGTEFAWGPTVQSLEDTKDYKTAVWAAEQLNAAYEQPFFMAIGLSRPHLPFYVPQEFFDLYPTGGDYLPPLLENDLEDILTPAGRPKFRATADYLWLKDNQLFDEAARAYLAATSYADRCLGVIFDALKASPHYENTIVVVWGDHGWHLGEKLRYRKGTGWSESTRIPLLVRLPGMDSREDCRRLVNMIDFYPTLIELCSLPDKPVLDGRSFVPLLKDPSQAWDYPTVTIHGEGNASIRDERWRYILYQDGTQELYDLEADPNEWRNLAAAAPTAALEAMANLKAAVPTTFAKAIPRSKSSRKKSAGIDRSIKMTRDLAKLR